MKLKKPVKLNTYSIINRICHNCGTRGNITGYCEKCGYILNIVNKIKGSYKIKAVSMYTLTLIDDRGRERIRYRFNNYHKAVKKAVSICDKGSNFSIYAKVEIFDYNLDKVRFTRYISPKSTQDIQEFIDSLSEYTLVL